MSIIYVRSTDGNNSDNGSTWALAKATLNGAAAIAASGDTIYVSQVHAETNASAISVNFSGALSNPVKVVCGNDGAAPPTALATSGTVTCTGSGLNVTFTGNFYLYGLGVVCGNGTVGGTHILGSTAAQQQIYEQCAFSVANTVTAAKPNISWANTKVIFKSCTYKFGAVGQGLYMIGSLYWNGGGIAAGGTSPTTLIVTYDATVAGEGGTLLMENLDLSNGSSTMNISAPPTANWNVTIRNCRLPGSWSGSLVNTTFTGPGRIAMYDCDNAATNYRLWIEDYAGTIRDETTLVRTGGASDGTTGLSWKMTTNANANYPLMPLASPEFVIWNDTSGSSKTVTVEILRDSATNLKDNEVWLEANYLGASGTPQGTLITDAVADVLTTSADQTTSAATWTTSGMSNPNTQKLAVTFTPQMKGYFMCRVMLAKASATVYVDPLATVS